MVQRLIDSHVHFWDPANIETPWLAALPALNKPFLPEDLKAEIGDRTHVEQMVFVQADVAENRSLDEVRWVTQLAQNHSEIAAVVAFAPLEMGQRVQVELEKLKQYPLVRGIRRLLQSEKAGFATQADFITGVKQLARFNYSFDICTTHALLPDAVEMVRRCPNVLFVLDHIGKPDIKTGLTDPWRQHIRELASCDNVSCKLSGIVTEADPEHWQLADLRPYIEHTLETFGVDRVMFGGDWPVVRLASDYPTWVDTLAEAAAALSESEKQKIFYDNAKNFYRL